MKVRLVACTQIDPEYAPKDSDLSFLENPEALMCYIARVSSPNQANRSYAKLLKYCLDRGHWSVFEQVDMTCEVETSRAIAAQILRHKSLFFQEFSQRYSAVGQDGVEVYKARRQDSKNRQNSLDDLPHHDIKWFGEAQKEVWDLAYNKYEEALSKGIAKECARFILPLSTKTRLYMKGSVRSWIHYIDLRSGNGTQKEHQDIALAIKGIFVRKFPTIAEAKGWA